MRQPPKKIQSKLELMRNCKEYENMWSELTKHPSNKWIKHPTVAFSPGSGEVWQYMGLSIDNTSHVFRHRDHPNPKYYKGSSLYINIPIRSMDEVNLYFM